MPHPRTVFVSGGTGYMGRELIRRLLQNGHNVRALARPGSENKVLPGCNLITGDALDLPSFGTQVAPADTMVHLVGVSHPAPWKADEFRKIDLASAQAAVRAAKDSAVQHFVYVSVGQPAPVMKAYIRVRAAAESMIREAGLNATILRPWYVLGPGHRWPAVLLPVYAILERLPRTRETALRLGLLTLEQMAGALLWAVENPAQGVRILDVPAIRKIAS